MKLFIIFDSYFIELNFSLLLILIIRPNVIYNLVLVS